MNRTRPIAIGITVATALVVVILLLMCRPVFDPLHFVSRHAR